MPTYMYVAKGRGKPWVEQGWVYAENLDEVLDELRRILTATAYVKVFLWPGRGPKPLVFRGWITPVKLEKPVWIGGGKP